MTRLLSFMLAAAVSILATSAIADQKSKSGSEAPKVGGHDHDHDDQDGHDSKGSGKGDGKGGKNKDEKKDKKDKKDKREKKDKHSGDRGRSEEAHANAPGQQKKLDTPAGERSPGATKEQAPAMKLPGDKDGSAKQPAEKPDAGEQRPRIGDILKGKSDAEAAKKTETGTPAETTEKKDSPLDPFGKKEPAADDKAKEATPEKAPEPAPEKKKPWWKFGN